jgi:histidinol dehydrogenase
MKIIESTDQRALERLLARNLPEERAIERRVRKIVDLVRSGGDHALAQLSKKFDGSSGPLEVSRDEMRADAAHVDLATRRALRESARNIAHVARRQIPESWKVQVAPGVCIEQRVEPLARVGCYVPGSRYPLASTLLMTAVPARVAGVEEIVVVCPRPKPIVMAAALETGVTKLFRIGGAHAIAALAYGTETIPRVDKIVGPGNRFVAAAKNLVARDCAIDFNAGPTELVIVAASGKPSWVARDLVAQAEHAPDARAILITWSRAFAKRVGREAARQNVAIVVTRSSEEAIMLANKIAPEHLVVDRESLAECSLIAGTVFVGDYSAQAAGDYATGSNHVLPTNGAAQFRGGLSAADFVRAISIQRVTRAGLARLAPTILRLARAEGLEAHAKSIEVST